MWLDIEGVPLHAWSKDAFRRSLAKWGYIAHLEDDLGEDVELRDKNLLSLPTFLNLSWKTVKHKALLMKIKNFNQNMITKMFPNTCLAFMKHCII